MKNLSYAVVALALCAAPALAQTTQTQTAPNSGTGVAGQAGGKNGPPAHATTNHSTRSTHKNSTVRNQDVSKVPGKAGGKSGPAAQPPKSQ
jgi:hypothetical protein